MLATAFFLGLRARRDMALAGRVLRPGARYPPVGPGCSSDPWNDIREFSATEKARGAPIVAPEPPPAVATDPLLLLNVLGRARGPVLIARTPLALEPAFLERELISRDARPLALARGEGR